VLIVGGNQTAGGYEVDNSLRFNEDNNDYLNRTPSSSSNRTTFTISVWVKRSDLGSSETFNIFQQRDNSNNSKQFTIQLRNDEIRMLDQSSGVNRLLLQTDRLFRDVSAWYHIVVAVDTTQGTSTNRAKLYINGVQETDFSSNIYYAQDYETAVNNTVRALIGASRPNSTGTLSNYFDGYMSEFVLIDGQQLDPTSFGEFDEDSGVWKPIDVSGLTFGTNGFYLPFENSAALGQDDSGNGNNFTLNNLTSIDQTTDTCTNNYATMNPLFNYYAQATFSEGNLQTITSDSVTNVTPLVSTMGVSTGKWYCEYKYIASTGGDFPVVGVTSNVGDRGTNESLQNYPNDHGYFGYDGNYLNDANSTPYGNSYTTGDIVGIALDLDNGYIYFHKNGTYQNSGDPTSGATGTGGKSVNLGRTYFFGTSDLAYTLKHTMQTNFGSPTFSISSGNSDGAGYGNFEYSVPSGYYALNTKNLAEYG
jgi:hypothetical protein